MIAAIGLCTLDHIMVLDSFKATEGTYKCDAYQSEGGGMAATAMCAAARLGSQTRLISRVGDDVNGTLIVQRLRDFGVDCSCIAVMPGQHSVVCVTLVETGGQKQFYTEKSWGIYDADPVFDPASLADVQVLMIDGHGGEVALQGIQWAQEQGVPVVADFKRRYKYFDAVLPHVDYLIIPEFFAREFSHGHTDSSLIQDFRALYKGVLVITQGSRGGLYGWNGGMGRYSAFPVEVVDTTGAGDAFHGAFCHYLALGKELPECLTLSSAVGALNCRALGGRKALPDPREVMHLTGGMT